MAKRRWGAKRFPVFLLLTIAGLFLFFGLVQAAGDTAHDQDRSADLKDLLYRGINFFLLVLILFLVLRKTGIKQVFRLRGEEIKEKLEDLRKHKEQAESKYRELEKQLLEFEKHKNEVIERFKAEGLAEKERIVAEARSKMNRIIEEAEASIHGEIYAARERLKSEMAALTALRAEEVILKEMTEKDQDRLVNDFIERVGKGH